MKPRVTIAYVFNESLSATVPCLQRLIDKTLREEYELICVDGNSPDSISIPLQQLSSKHNFTLIRSDEFLTHNESRNIALKQVQTQYIVFVDNDVEVGENWLTPLINCAEETGAWLVAPLYMESRKGKLAVHMYGGECDFKDNHGSPCFIEKHIKPHSDLETIKPLVRHETKLIEFHTLLMDMDAYHTLGELDEKLLSHSQHTDLCYAVEKVGQKIFIEPSSVITHLRPEGRLKPIDKEYFSLRWSEAWSDKTLERLSEKYLIPLNESGMQDLRWWVRFHRQSCIAEYPIVRKLFKKKLHNLYREIIGLPIERRLNVWRYPAFKYTYNRTVNIKTIQN